MNLKALFYLFVSGIASLALLTSTTMAEPLEVGAAAPRVTATIETGEQIDLGQAYDKGPVLVYFYPRSDTPGCTKQACNLRDNFAALADKGVTVFGVSSDKVAAQKKFKDKYNLPFSLIADADFAVGEAFGTGRSSKSFSRQSFLVVDGKIVWRDLKAKPATQAEDALAALEAAQ